MERVLIGRRFVVLCTISVLLCSLLSVVESQAGSSLLVRFPVRSTDALGLQLLEMFGRLQTEHFSGPRPDPAGATTGGGGTTTAKPDKRPPREVSTRVPVGVLPGGNVTVGADYDTVVQGPANPTSLIVVMHGMGSTPEQLTPLAVFAKQELPRTRFVFARAPKQHVNYIGRKLESWFNIDKRVAGRENVAELRAAAAGVSKIVLDQKRIYNFTDDKIVVLGMSQGGAVALTFYLAEKVRVAGVIGAATWLPLPTLWKAEALAAENDNTPVHIVHGRLDKVITTAEAKRSADILEGLGREVTYKEYAAAGHSMVKRFGVVVPDLIAKSKEMMGE